MLQRKSGGAEYIYAGIPEKQWCSRRRSMQLLRYLYIYIFVYLYICIYVYMSIICIKIHIDTIVESFFVTKIEFERMRGLQCDIDTYIHMYNSFICVVRLTYMCDLTHPYV